MPSNESEQRSELGLLAVAARAGDRPAFEALVRQTARTLFARFYLDTADSHRAEDLVQETYLLAWRRIRSLDDPEKFFGWLMSIARSVMVDSVRHAARKKRDASQAPAIQIGGRSPAEDVERNEERSRVLTALRELPEEYRLPLMLRYLDDADYETISKQLAQTNGSLRGLLSRGMKMLREKMTNDQTRITRPAARVLPTKPE